MEMNTFQIGNLSESEDPSVDNLDDTESKSIYQTQGNYAGFGS